MLEPPQKLYYISMEEIKHIIADKYKLNINDIDMILDIKEVGAELNEKFGSYIQFNGIEIQSK